MSPTKPIVKIATVIFAVLLLAAFIAYRSGFFDGATVEEKKESSIEKSNENKYSADESPATSPEELEETMGSSKSAPIFTPKDSSKNNRNKWFMETDFISVAITTGASIVFLTILFFPLEKVFSARKNQKS